MVQKTSDFSSIQFSENASAAQAASTSGFSIPMAVNLLPTLNNGMLSFASPAQSGAAAPPPEPVSAPTFAKASDNFGTMRHVEPVRDHLINAFLTLEKLRLFATEAPGTEEPLLTRVENYLKAHLSDDEFTALLAGVGVSVPAPDDKNLKLVTPIDPTLKNTVGMQSKILSARFFKSALPRIGDLTTISLGDVVDNPGEVKNISIPHNTHSALFSTGKVVADDIRTMEALRLAMVKVRRNLQTELESKQAKLAALEARVKNERSTLNGLEAERSETLDDYAVAQRLLAEHWAEAEQAYAERKRVIESNVGLYYVRVRETPLSHSLPDPLDLRSGSADDLVPGCPNTTTPLTEELLPFMNTLLDIPAGDWAVLSGLSNLLPGRAVLEQMVQMRRQTLTVKLQQPAVISSSINPTLIALLQTHQTLQQSIAVKPFAIAALRDMQLQGHKILALEDMLASTVPGLRTPATQLHQRLNAAAGCLLSRLRAIKPSIRLAWADLADDNRLPVENPERWPNLDKAEADDFNNLRTLVELIGWWFRQLDSDASGDSRTALRNFIRACLLLAASDDPQQLLQGQLKTLPTRFRIGELLRLDLNREPAAGNLLHLLDDKQQVVATLRVEDHDNKGTLASIASVITPSIQLTLAMRVTGQRT